MTLSWFSDDYEMIHRCCVECKRVAVQKITPDIVLGVGLLRSVNELM